MTLNSLLNKCIMLLSAALLCVALIIGSFFVQPTFVHALSQNNDFDVLYSSSSTSTSVYQEGYSVIKDTSGNYISVYKTFSTGYPDLYFFVYGTSSLSYCFACKKTETSNLPNQNLAWVYKPNGGIGLSKNNTSGYNISGDVQYFDNHSFSYSFTAAEIYCPKFDTLNEGLSALNYYINNPPGVFYTFPQVSAENLITYELIEGQGVMVYASPNTYHLCGAYNGDTAPASQYCYIDNGDGTTNFAVFSSVPLTVYSAFLNGETYTYSVCTQYDNGKYYYVFPEIIQSEIEKSFSSLADAQNAFSGASSGEPSGVASAGPLTVEVPAGNVLYAKPRAGSLGNIKVTFPVLSSSSSPYWTERNCTAKWLSGVSSLPDANTKFPLSGMSNITFIPDESKGLDGYGRSYYGTVSHAPFNSGWFVVYNPAYTRSMQDDVLNSNPATFNPTLTVNLQYCTEYHIYDLSETILPTGNESSSTTDYTTSQDGLYDDENDQWDITSSLPTPSGDPDVGGQQNNYAYDSKSLVEYVRDIGNVLSQFANSVVDLLKAPIAHIQSLITAGGTFFAMFAQMFTWLPPEVYAILTAALSLVIVIAVIKLFVK